MATLHEYQGKQIFKQHDIAIPRGRVAFSAVEAGEIAAQLNCEVVVKAQIHGTSRAASGGIKFAKNAAEAIQCAAEILANPNVAAVLADEKLEIAHEFYLGFIVDERLKRPTLLFSESGGSGIEERAETMKTLVCSVRTEPTIAEVLDFVQSSRLRLQSPAKRDGWQTEVCTLNAIAEILIKLYRVAKATDARTAEINPLALVVPLSSGEPSKDGTTNKLVALDARISVDDYADFRQKDLGIEIARELGHTPTKLEKIAWNIEKDDFRGTFFFVEILPNAECGMRNPESKADIKVKNNQVSPNNTEEAQSTNPQSKLQNPKSKIGFHGAGGGGSMASLDAAQRNSLQPACYVDTSGNPPASKVYRAAKIILSIPNIKGYFLSGSGVASQEQFGLARAVLKAFLEVKPTIPAVLRLGGNGEDIAKELVERYAKFLPAPIEAYQKRHSADFCAARLKELIEDAETRRRGDTAMSVASALADAFYADYKFETKTGTISFNYNTLDESTAMRIVESCPNKILKLNENNKPILAIEAEEAERGKCSECLACEFASLDLGLNAVKIDFPIEGL